MVSSLSFSPAPLPPSLLWPPQSGIEYDVHKTFVHFAWPLLTGKPKPPEQQIKWSAYDIHSMHLHMYVPMQANAGSASQIHGENSEPPPLVVLVHRI